MKTGYSIKTIKYKLRCSHPEWLTETEKYYRQVLDFYFRLLLEHEEIWELNVLQMQGSLERLTIAGRDGRIPEQPLPLAGFLSISGARRLTSLCQFEELYRKV